MVVEAPELRGGFFGTLAVQEVDDAAGAVDAYTAVSVGNLGTMC